ncbi:MAG: hypothetical protein M1822_000043 [Bathelium mastoideum]|nr:MAG: hypothetical protein M1822_000043 [Bathelium mastoideum]
MATIANPEPGVPYWMPKLTYRNRMSNDEFRPIVDSTNISGLKMLTDEKSTRNPSSISENGSLEISVIQIVDAEDGDGRRDSSSLHQPMSVRRSDSRPSTARTISSSSGISKHEEKQMKKKKSSMLEFLTVKEPSTRAFEEFAEQERKKAAAKGNRSMTTLPGVSSARLPSTVPKVNSKWDGMPRESDASKARRLAAHRGSISTGRTSTLHSQTSRAHSFVTESSFKNGPAILNSRISSLRGLDRKAPTISSNKAGSDSESTTSLDSTRQPDLSKFALDTSADWADVVSSDKLATPEHDLDQLDASKIGIPLVKTNEIIEITTSNPQTTPVTAQPWPSKPLHSPSGSHDAHIHPAFRESGRIYESESSNSSSELLSKNGSDLGTPRNASPVTPADLVLPHEELFDTVSISKSSDSGRTELGENWPLPGLDAEPVIFHSTDNHAVLFPSFIEMGRRPPIPAPRDSGVRDAESEIAISPKKERSSRRTTTFNFSRRDSIFTPRRPLHESFKDSEQEQSSEKLSAQDVDPVSLHYSHSDLEKSIHLGVGFNTDDIASIAESQAPSEMSARWFKAPKERLGLGSRMWKKDGLPWDVQDEDRFDRKRRFPVPLFNRT